MIQALFYKELIKTQRVILLLVLLFAGFIAYTFIDIAQMFRVSGAVAVWSNIILKDIVLLPNIKWLPLIAGLFLAITQYTPEMIDKRLKLTLHLPLPENKIIIIMLAYGLLVLTALYLVSYLVIMGGIGYYFSGELVTSSFYLTIPWFIGGYAGYLLATWIIYEPVWKQRIFNAIISICTLMLFYIDGKSGAYIPFIPYLLLILILSFSFLFYSTARFKEGAQY